MSVTMTSESANVNACLNALNKAIAEMSEDFTSQYKENINCSVQCRPQYTFLYISLAASFQRASEVCDKYLETSDLKVFVEDMIGLGYIGEVLFLKKLITDPDVLNRILQEEEYYVISEP